MIFTQELLRQLFDVQPLPPGVLVEYPLDFFGKENMTIKLDEEVASELTYADQGNIITEVDGETPLYTVVETEEFGGEGKYQHKNVIFSDKDGNFFSLNATRSGSHFTDWYMEYELECPQVFKKERIIKEVYYE